MEAGELVRPTAGHDSGRLYLVLRVEGDFAYLTDGKHHGLNKPKKKRLKHIVPVGVKTSLSVIECDAHVRKAIKRLNPEGGCQFG